MVDYYFLVYQSPNDRKFYWRLIIKYNESELIIATGHQGFTSREEAHKQIAAVKTVAPDARIEDA